MATSYNMQENERVLIILKLQGRVEHWFPQTLNNEEQEKWGPPQDVQDVEWKI